MEPFGTLSLKLSEGSPGDSALLGCKVGTAGNGRAVGQRAGRGPHANRFCCMCPCCRWSNLPLKYLSVENPKQEAGYRLNTSLPQVSQADTLWVNL